MRVQLMTEDQPAIVLEEITHPAEVARVRAQDERHRRNQEWLETHWSSLSPHACGKFVAIAGQEAFVAPTAAEACARAESAHPDDDGAIVRYVRPTAGPRIYASRRALASMR